MPAILAKTIRTFSSDIPSPGAETAIIVSAPVFIFGENTRVIIRAWVQIANGVGASTYTLRIRRGTLVTDPLVGEGNAVNLASAETREACIVVSETVLGPGRQAYVLTMASGIAMTAIQGAIEIETQFLRDDVGSG